MISALKMIAEVIADSGAVQVQDVELGQAGDHAREHGRDDGEVLRHVVGDREGGQRAAGDQQLLADLHDLDELGRVGVQVHHVPRLLGGGGAGVHGHADVGLGERGGVVGAVAGHRDQLAALLLLLDQRHLVFRRRLGEEVVHAGLVGDRLGGERVVTGDHDGPDAHLAHLGEPLGDALLDDVLEVDHAERASGAVHLLGDDQRSAADGRDAVDQPPSSSGGVPPLSRTHCHRRTLAPLRTCRPSARSMPLILVCAVNSTNSAPCSSPSCRSRRPYCSLASTDDRTAFRRVVGHAGQLRRIGEFLPRRRR